MNNTGKTEQYPNLEKMKDTGSTGTVDAYFSVT